MAESPDGAVLAARPLQRVTAREDSAGPEHPQAAATPGWTGEARFVISLEIAPHLTLAVS
ncbi:hypothetical protein ACFW93_37360 [Streptomyces canus]|uniref:hypothetical protein n=1 Tax=Streptomyces canus TaxID=58343 RepID=UPI0036D1C025